MKYGMKKFNEDELAMMVSIASIDAFDAKDIMIRKGDVEKLSPFVPMHMDDDSWYIPSKSMKRSNRRKATFHKREQRKKMYLHKGYTIERFDERDIGMLSEGVGAAPKAMHMDSMYFHGDKDKKKMKKPITALEAMSLMEEQKRLDAEDAAKEYVEAEKAIAKEYITDMEYEVKRLTEVMGDTKDYIIELEEHLNELRNQFEEAYGLKRHLLDKIKEMEVFVDSDE